MAHCKDKDDAQNGSFNEDLDDQPETQPFEVDQQQLNQLEESSVTPEGLHIWGYLHPHPNTRHRSLALSKENYFFGRHPKNDYTFRQEDFLESNVFNSISNSQFKIVKERVPLENGPVYLYDLSSNGTFLNKVKLGKGQKGLLGTNDEIAIVYPSCKVFVYIDNTIIEDAWLVPAMRKKYAVKILLGHGTFGEVKMATNKITHKDVAIKKIRHGVDREKMIENEIKILKTLKHPLIISMEDVYETNDHVFLVLDYITGGTLKEKISNHGKLSNNEAKPMFYQLTLGLEYLHGEGVAHRDLKPANVLLSPCEEGILVKIADFGLSKIIDDGQTELRTFVGTMSFLAPEVLMSQFTGSYTHQVDVWSLGAMLFYGVSGKLPFSSERTTCSVQEQILRVSYSISGPEWHGVDPKSIRLIKKMLVFDPKKRITIPEMIEHSWFKDNQMKDKVRRIMEYGFYKK